MATAPATAPVRIAVPVAVPPKPHREFFVYGIDFLALTALSVSQSSIQIQADSTFELQKLSFFADVALAAQTQGTRILPLVTLQITDSGTGRNVFSTDLALPSVMGDGQIPFILPVTKMFKPNTSLLVSVTNFSATEDYNLRLSLIGAKIFRFG
jgi:hypothetical protein